MNAHSLHRVASGRISACNVRLIAEQRFWYAPRLPCEECGPPRPVSPGLACEDLLLKPSRPQLDDGANDAFTDAMRCARPWGLAFQPQVPLLCINI